MRRRSPHVAIALSIAAVVSTVGCAVITGVDEYGVEDPAATTSQPNPDGSSGDEGGVDGGGGPDVVSDADPQLDAPPPCDPKKDNACIQLPAGFELVAVAKSKDAMPAACPSGFGNALDLGTTPQPKPDTCTCACAVTAQGKCEGAITNAYGNDATCSNAGAGQNLKNSDNCNNDIPNSFSPFQKFSLTPSGGSCANAAPVAHPDRVTWFDPSRVCPSVTRCGSGVCDGTNVPAPFAACIAGTAAAGDIACPPEFPSKQVLGVTASFTCGACGACTLTRSTCTGTITIYRNAGCGSVQATGTIDGACHPFPATGSLDNVKGYVVNATTTTTCTGANAAASNAAIASSRTVCCR